MNKVKAFFEKMWRKIKESKLNMGMFIAGVVAVALIITIICIIMFRGDGIDNTLTVDKGNSQTQTKNDGQTTPEETTKKGTAVDEEEFTTKIDENETTNLVTNAGLLKLKSTIQKSWEDDGERYIQYSIEITNVSGKDIESWAMVIDFKTPYELVDAWNFNFKEGYKKFAINPLNSNKEIEAGEKVTGGFIVKSDKYVYLDYYTAYIGNRVETLKASSNMVTEQKTTPAETTKPKETEEETTTKPKENEETTTVAETETSSLTEENEETTTTKETEEETTTPKQQEETTTTKEQEEETTTHAAEETTTAAVESN